MNIKYANNLKAWFDRYETTAAAYVTRNRDIIHGDIFLEAIGAVRLPNLLVAAKNAIAINQNLYKNSALVTLNTNMTSATTLFTNLDSSVTTANTLATTIGTTITTLTGNAANLRANITVLKPLVDYIFTLNGDLYTPATWFPTIGNANGANFNIIAVNQGGDVDQSTINSQVTLLQGFIAGLHLKPNKAALQALVNQVNTLHQADYTSLTWGNMMTAFGNAQTPLNNPESVQSEVDAAVVSLTAAINALVHV